MSKSLEYLSLILNLNERLFGNALEGISEEQAKERISDHNNPVNWIAAHTVYARYLMLMFLGKPAPNPYQEMFDNFKPYDAAVNYPDLSQIKSEWQKVTGLIKEAIGGVSEDTLSGDSPIKSPIGDFTNGGTLAFLVEHESYDVGQIAFLKKYHTNEAMKY